jgi:hypothetical protein
LVALPKGRSFLYYVDGDILLITSTGCIRLVAKKRGRGNKQNMSQMIAYLRTSTDKQDVNNQKLEILERYLS